MARNSFGIGEANVSLNAATSTGAGDEFGIVPFGALPLLRTFAWDVIVTGGPATLRVDIEGSLDGTNWFQLDTYTSTASTLRFVVDKPVKYVRANLVTLTGGSSPSTTTRIAG